MHAPALTGRVLARRLARLTAVQLVGPRRDRLLPRRVWSWAPGDCSSSKGRSACFRCVFSVLIPLSNSHSVLIPVLIPVLIHGFASRATRNKLSVNRF